MMKINPPMDTYATINLEYANAFCMANSEFHGKVIINIVQPFQLHSAIVELKGVRETVLNQFGTRRFTNTLGAISIPLALPTIDGMLL